MHDEVTVGEKDGLGGERGGGGRGGGGWGRWGGGRAACTMMAPTGSEKDGGVGKKLPEPTVGEEG